MLSDKEQQELLRNIDTLLEAGMRKQLPGTTFLQPPRTKAGNGRRTIQFGCAYEYRNSVDIKVRLYVLVCVRLSVS